MSLGEMYAPKVLGETGEAVYDIANSAHQLTEDAEIIRNNRKEND